MDERAGDVGVIRDETSVEVGKAKERSNILDFLGGGPAGDTVQLYGIHGKLTRFDNHAEVFYFGSGEATFLQFEVEVQFRHALEDVFGAFTVSFFVGGEDKKVVHINDKPSFGDHVTERVVHESLEHGGGVGKPEEHYRWFEEAFMCNESGLPLVTVLDVDVVVPPADVKLSKQFGIFEFVDEVGNEGKWIGVAGGMFIQVSVILTGVEATILLFDKEERRCLGRVRRANLSTVEDFLEEVLGGFSFFRG